MGTGLSSVERRLRKVRVGLVRESRSLGEYNGRCEARVVKVGKGKKGLLQAARETRPSKCMKKALNVTRSSCRQYAAEENVQAGWWQ